MIFLGDVFLDKPYNVELEFEHFIFNLEYPLSCHGDPAINKVNLCQNNSYIKETFGKNPLAVCLANNHIMDYGEDAFLKTINFLEKNNIKYFGAGTTDNNFNNPCILNLNKKSIALFGYSCPSTHAIFGSATENGSALLDEEKIIKDIQAIRKKVDFIVLQLHWGDEEIKYPKPADVKKARAFIDAGADLIIGHHAHVIQSHEIYNGKNIYYGLGNFIFPDFDVPAYFDGKKFKTRFLKKQNKTNRQALLVTLDSDEGVTHRTLQFDDSSIKEKRIQTPTWIPKTKKQYNLYYKFWLRLNMLEHYLQNPCIPSITQIKLFLGLK